MNVILINMLDGGHFIRDGVLIGRIKGPYGFIMVLALQEMERLENQPCEWDDHMLAQALESEQRREKEEQRLREEEELKKLQV